ncbi:MAG TPA: molybdopterin-guanine dinucleotide biosynthesis protein A [Alphaproteobacteria bacterium]|nr:molybdopterin-guanine dinucleotide biosynthesis protein A [Alphaproteobacteria bacterium]
MGRWAIVLIGLAALAMGGANSIAAQKSGGAAGKGKAENARKGKYDRHEGYYYPPLKDAPEIYKARAVTLVEASRGRRIAFVTALTNQMMKNAYPPPFAIFAKGDNAEKLIIVGLYEGAYNTLYRARGLLAILTARARLTPVFRKHQVEDVFTFFDFLKLQGFERLTITDGKSYSHQVRFQ